ncbi:MAG: hypothetical protein IT473_05435 [Lysobacter sp.]|nr:hypothetical protein [Lysobacter sp.]
MRNFTAIVIATGIALTAFQAESKDLRADDSFANPLNLPCPEQPVYASGVFSPQLLDECGGDPGGGGGGGDPGGGGGGGGYPPPPPPFSPPFMLPPVPGQGLPIPLYNPNSYSTCNQFPHPFVAFTNDLARGSTLYLSGIVAPGTAAFFGFYDQYGQRVDYQMTNAGKSNCVIHHDQNPYDTNRLAPGYYTVYASYISLGAPYTVQCFYGGFPPNFNFYVVTPGFHCPMPTQYVTTIRIR